MLAIPTPAKVGQLLNTGIPVAVPIISVDANPETANCNKADSMLLNFALELICGSK